MIVETFDIYLNTSRLIPWLSVLYLLLSLDRNNIGNARLGTLEKDLNLVGNDYYTALTIFFAGKLNRIMNTRYHFIYSKFYGRLCPFSYPIKSGC